MVCERLSGRYRCAIGAEHAVSSAAVAAGLGLGVIPCHAARLLPHLRPLSLVVARGTGWMVVDPDLQHVPRIRVVIDMLVATFRAEHIAA